VEAYSTPASLAGFKGPTVRGGEETGREGKKSRNAEEKEGRERKGRKKVEFPNR